MKVVTVKEQSDIELIPLSDLHLGSPVTNLRKIDKILAYIRENPKTRVVLLGDLLESAVIGSKGDPYNSKTLNEEIDIAISVLEPIKDKIIGIVSGNHERRISKSVGLDVLQLLCRKLNLEDKYSPDFLVLIVSMTKTSWYIVLHHGIGSGRTKGGRINNLQRYSNIVINADIIITGHTHDLIITVDERFSIDKKRKTLTKQKIYYINVPSISMEYGGYSSSYAYPPTLSGAVKIHLPDVPNFNKNKIDLSIMSF